MNNGILIKTHTNSWFENYHLNSARARSRLEKDARYITLQTMVVGEMEIIAEVITREDYFTSSKKEDK